MQGFYLSSGLLTSQHKQAIGSALWEFAWLIDHETRTNGKVLNGTPIPLCQISTDLGQHDNTTSRHLNRLVKKGYIARDARPGGAFTYTVLNSKKWKPVAAAPPTEIGATPPTTPTPEVVPPHTSSGVTPTPEVVRPHTSSGGANKELDSETKSRQGDRGANPRANPAPAPPVYVRDYAERILDEFHLPSLNDNLRKVIKAIESEVKSHGSTVAAYEFIRRGCREGEAEGYSVNGHFFEDACYRAEKRRKPVKTFAQMKQDAIVEARHGVLELLEQRKMAR